MKKILVFLLFFSDLAFSGLEVTPAYINARADGKKEFLEVPIRIVNTSLDKTEYLDISVSGSVKNINEEWDYSIKPDERNSLASWILLSDKKIEIKPKEERIINAKIQIKAKKNGDYRGTIFITQNMEKTIALMKKNQKDQGMSSSATMYAISKIAIPVTVRLLNANKSMPGIQKKVMLGQLNAQFDHAAGSLLKVQAVITNKANFSVENTGRCELLSSSGTLLFMEPIHRVETFANEKTRVQCVFNDYIPANKYKMQLQVNTNIKNRPESIALAKTKPFIVTSEDEKQVAKSILNRDDDKLLTPLKVVPSQVLLSRSDEAKPMETDITVQNLSGSNMLVRPFFLAMPEKAHSKKVSIKPKRFSLKPYASKKVTLRIKPQKEDLFGKLILSAKKHKEKFPVAINLALQASTAPAPAFKLQGEPNINIDENGHAQLFARFKNTTNHYLEKLQTHLDLIHTDTNKLLEFKTLRSKSSLLPGESSSAYFLLEELEAGHYEMTLKVQQGNEMLPLEKHYLKVSNADGKTDYQFIYPSE